MQQLHIKESAPAPKPIINKYIKFCREIGAVSKNEESYGWKK
jgi:hypothetical protein